MELYSLETNKGWKNEELLASLENNDYDDEVDAIYTPPDDKLTDNGNIDDDIMRKCNEYLKKDISGTFEIYQQSGNSLLCSTDTDMHAIENNRASPSTSKPVLFLEHKRKLTMTIERIKSEKISH
ncbi:hypothetical protein HHI36_002171 [Cryptolaemus montrouzieri]|uniref:Uncharacterized protein n=1 Tax=Cryptolaemus montrouzieri TaxID=559131 RepID=A0ABD2P9N0_9CUCU